MLKNEDENDEGVTFNEEEVYTTIVNLNDYRLDDDSQEFLGAFKNQAHTCR